MQKKNTKGKKVRKKTTQKSFDEKQKNWNKTQIKNWKGWLKFVLKK